MLHRWQSRSFHHCRWCGAWIEISFLTYLHTSRLILFSFFSDSLWNFQISINQLIKPNYPIQIILRVLKKYWNILIISYRKSSNLRFTIPDNKTHNLFDEDECKKNMTEEQRYEISEHLILHFFKSSIIYWCRTFAALRMWTIFKNLL